MKYYKIYQNVTADLIYEVEAPDNLTKDEVLKLFNEDDEKVQIENSNIDWDSIDYPNPANYIDDL